VLAWAVHRLAGRTWRWTTGAGWLAAAHVCVAQGVRLRGRSAATLVLALTPPGSSGRWTVLAVQAAVQAVVAQMAGAYDSAQVAEDWETTYDGYIELVANR
jgi:hypothetical protein